ncbi:alpha/beta fold hydrolase [Streptomyces phaeochromogenes]|uniref:alpha/beta fold hydrolase n=1 Tax=Streptomyces phaeochromogenes TaxID=1923 RepID=UPI002DDA9352|nr:alpha/beta fold hydrolase [Streptomyces phaeochromogenes]WRZ34448.1 alpha/beta fold hydrolase [Streptomyces phaeochromogenes]
MGTSTVLWNRHAVALADFYRVLSFDLPGHGGTPSDILPDLAPGSTRIEDLGRLVLDLVDQYGAERFHYAGISLGGAIGAHLAIHHPERVASLAMVCSSAHFGPPEPWQDRAGLVRSSGTGPLLTVMPGRWFADPATATGVVGRSMLRNLAAAERAGYAACCDALAGYDITPELDRVTAPTLVIGGIYDVATPMHHARELADGIPRATLAALATGHLAVEDPGGLTAALRAHLRVADTMTEHG